MTSIFIHHKLPIILGALLTVMTVCVYWQVSGFEFTNFDDDVVVYENSHVREGLSWENIRWAFGGLHVGTWQPVTWLSHMLDVELFDMDAGKHHLVSMLFHLANTLLLYFLLLKMTGTPWPSALTAALFALHPLHVESVAWVAERKDVLSTFWGMLTLLAYQAWTHKPTLWRYLLIAVSFSIGLMAKPMLVTLPAVLLLLDIWPLDRVITGESCRYQDLLKRAGRLIIEKLPFFALSLASGIVTMLAESRIGSMVSVEQLPLVDRLQIVILAYTTYLQKTIWPTRLVPYYLFPELPGFGASAVLLIFLLGITAFCLWSIRRFPFLAVGWFWYLIVLLPVSGILQTGGFAWADRFSYIPLIGIFIMIAWSGEAAYKRWPALKAPLAVGCSLLIIVFGAVAYRQVGHWRNTVSLFEKHMIKIDPANDHAYVSMGAYYRDRGEWQPALENLKAALRMNPVNHEAAASVANTYEKMGRLQEAAAWYARSVQINPNFVEAIDYLGMVQVKLGNLEAAKQSFKRSLELNPDDIKVWMNYAFALFLNKEYDKASVWFKRALDQDPLFVPAYNGLGLVLTEQGRLREAIAIFEKALAIDPDYQHAIDNLNKARELMKNQLP